MNIEECKAAKAAWLADARLEEALRVELTQAVTDEDIEDRFYRELEFGTSGLRGVMGAGTNRMNIHVIDRATQGLAKYMLDTFEDPSVAIAYDTRNNSRRFAEETAKVMLGNGVKVYMFPMPTPVPSLSYAIRALELDMGVMVTASHNPKQYNGYKVYGPIGCQIVDDVVPAIYDRILKEDYFEGILREDVDFDDPEQEEFEYISEDILDEFIQEAVDQSIPAGGMKELQVVYTPLNGVGGPFIMEALFRAGLRRLMPVEVQMVEDGDFPTCPSPNPERPEAFKEAFKTCDEYGGDLILATDPDCDRIGIAIKREDGYWHPTGNQIGVLLANYLFANREDAAGKTLVRTIVTTPFVDEIAKAYGVNVRQTLTGFKYIGMEAESLGEDFLMGFEEANGYMVADHIRDKDGVSAGLLVTQMTAFYKQRGMDLYDALEDIYEEYGFSLEESYGFVFPGADGAEIMKEKMDGWRKDPSSAFPADQYTVKDYAPGIEGLPKANVLEFVGKSGAKIIIRPSGTEPKIKAYLFVRDEDRGIARARMDAVKEQVIRIMGTDPEAV